MIDLKLTDTEYRFLQLIYDAEPLRSKQLVELCDKALGWKKSTTFTMLKKLCQKGVVANNGSVVSSVIDRQEIERFRSRDAVQQSFGGSLPNFLTAFMGGQKLSEQEAQLLQAIIEQHREQ